MAPVWVPIRSGLGVRLAPVADLSRPVAGRVQSVSDRDSAVEVATQMPGYGDIVGGDETLTQSASQVLD